MQLQCLAAIEMAIGLLPTLGSDLTGLYAQVADAAPKARIVETGYPFLFGPPAAGDPNAVIINAIREATARLNATIEQAVGAARDADVKIVCVDVTAAFARHGIGTSDPFINGPTAGVEAFHPNAAGNAA
jgi:hypothetical protein